MLTTKTLIVVFQGVFKVLKRIREKPQEKNERFDDTTCICHVLFIDRNRRPKIGFLSAAFLRVVEAITKYF